MCAHLQFTFGFIAFLSAQISCYMYAFDIIYIRSTWATRCSQTQSGQSSWLTTCGKPNAKILLNRTAPENEFWHFCWSRIRGDLVRLNDVSATAINYCNRRGREGPSEITTKGKLTGLEICDSFLMKHIRLWNHLHNGNNSGIVEILRPRVIHRWFGVSWGWSACRQTRRLDSIVRWASVPSVCLDEHILKKHCLVCSYVPCKWRTVCEVTHSQAAPNSQLIETQVWPNWFHSPAVRAHLQ